MSVPNPLELLMVDPATLVIGDNVRTTVDLDQDPEFVQSIADHGVMHPILADLHSDGTVVVVDGQRRTLGALAAHRPVVPVVVRRCDPDTEPDQATRIGEQIRSNDQRTALTHSQRAAGIAAMLDLGLSVTAVAKTASVDRSKVKALATVGASAAARTSMDDHQLTLDQATVIAEFEAEGDTHGIERLLGTSTFNFDYKAQQLRVDREERLARAAAEAPYRDKGFTIKNGYSWNPITHEEVLDDDGNPISLDTVEADPARWGVALSYTESWFDRETGVEVSEDDVDWETEEQPDLEPEEGLRHARTIETRRCWDREFHLLDPDDLDGSGLHLSETAKALRNRQMGRRAEPVAMTAEAEAELKEQQRQERRRTRELNKRAAVILSQLHCYCCDQDRFDADVSTTQPSIWSDFLLEILRRRVATVGPRRHG
ncbi:ParB N-terminal domain-containing protein [Rhodococcus sp. Q]|uniref:ParB/RepB/Spo0J family partition protein n=1 Tax=Rhodococcus sp. Q TaxID=2502252 RepID=UPI0010F84F12|nr:ParB N-terminal domain-containing protein [Rhodococcus sp. Q]